MKQKAKWNLKRILFSLMVTLLTLTACTPRPTPITISEMPTLTEALPTATPSPPTLTPSPKGRTLVVTSPADSGPGTLRQALLDAQTYDTITFDPLVFPPNAPETIFPTSGLPPVTQGNLTIDASNAGVILNGNKITIPEFQHGIIVSSDHNVFRGLQIVGFSDAGIALGGGVQYNLIGGDRTVGDGPLGQGNLLSGNNFGVGLWDEATSHNTIQGNYIGITLDGTATWGNARDGVHSNGATQNMIIGNVIGGNESAGVYLCCVLEGKNTVTDNLIGVGPSGIPLGNQLGVLIDRSRYNVVGPGNVIAQNLGDGVSFWEDTPFNIVTRNSIHDNGGGGIVFSPGQNTIQSPLVINFDIKAGIVSGAACANCIVEIFSDTRNEGEIYEGQTKAGEDGVFAFNKGTLLAGPSLTATALDPDGNTSEFSSPTQGTSQYLSLQGFEMAAVVFVKDGNILVWDEATGQSQTIFDSGDVIRVELSDDGQQVAFLRRFTFAAGGFDNHQKSALWIVGRNGENPRELVSAEQLRALLNAAEADSTNFPRLEWVPNTHRLLYSGNTYNSHGYGEGAHTPTRGVYLVDADSLAHAELAPADSSPAFEPSPDGQQVALLTPTGLSFVNVDGSDRRQDVLTYPAVGRPGRIIPTGVWTQDARAFVIVAPIESGSERVLNFTIWRVPVDGSPALALTTLRDTGPYVTFAPDGSVAAFSRWAPAGGQEEPVSGTFITPLAEDIGPLAGPAVTDIYGPSMWSPGGSAYVLDVPGRQDLFQLCRNASQLLEVCGPPIHFAGPIDYLEWIDGSHFLYVTREPKWLCLGALDGSATPIVQDPLSFAALASTCRDDSEFVSDVTVRDGTHFAPDTLFRKTWRIRNTGTCFWDESYRFTFLSGDRMSGPRSVPLGRTVQPGEEVDLSVTLIAPETAGTYEGRWQLFARDGKPFGIESYVIIVIPQRQAQH